MADEQDGPHIEYRGSIEKQGFEAADEAAREVADHSGAFNTALDAEFTRIDGRTATRDVLAAHEQLLEQGLTFHDSPARDTDYTGFSHQQLYQFVNDKLSPEQINDIGYHWTKVGNDQIDVAEDIHNGLKHAGADWQGDASEGAKNFLKGLSGWFADGGRGMALTGNRINAMRDTASWARQNMPEPQDFTAKDAAGIVMDANVFTIGSAGDDAVAASGASRDAHAEAVRVMNGFAGSMTDHSAQVPAYSQPPDFDTGAWRDGSGGQDTAHPPAEPGKSHRPPPSVPEQTPDDGSTQAGHEPELVRHHTLAPPPDITADPSETATTTASEVPSPAAATPSPGTAPGGGAATTPPPASNADGIGRAYGSVRDRLGGGTSGRGPTDGGSTREEPRGRHAAGRSRQPEAAEPRGGRRSGAGRSTQEPTSTRTPAERTPAGRGRGATPMTGSRGGKQGEDKEHKNRYVTVDGQRTFGDDRKVPPAVIGELPEEARRRERPDGPGKRQ